MDNIYNLEKSNDFEEREKNIIKKKLNNQKMIYIKKEIYIKQIIKIQK